MFASAGQHFNSGEKWKIRLWSETQIIPTESNTVILCYMGVSDCVSDYTLIFARDVMHQELSSKQKKAVYHGNLQVLGTVEDILRPASPALKNRWEIWQLSVMEHTGDMSKLIHTGCQVWDFFKLVFKPSHRTQFL